MTDLPAELRDLYVVEHVETGSYGNRSRSRYVAVPVSKEVGLVPRVMELAQRQAERLGAPAGSSYAERLDQHPAVYVFVWTWEE